MSSFLISQALISSLRSVLDLFKRNFVLLAINYDFSVATDRENSPDVVVSCLEVFCYMFLDGICESYGIVPKNEVQTAIACTS